MVFEEIKNASPDVLCTCGHRAGIHLYCGDHFCASLGCECESFELEVRPGDMLIPVASQLALSDVG